MASEVNAETASDCGKGATAQTEKSKQEVTRISHSCGCTFEVRRGREIPIWICEQHRYHRQAVLPKSRLPSPVSLHFVQKRMQARYEEQRIEKEIEKSMWLSMLQQQQEEQTKQQGQTVDDVLNKANKVASQAFVSDKDVSGTLFGRKKSVRLF